MLASLLYFFFFSAQRKKKSLHMSEQSATLANKERNEQHKGEEQNKNTNLPHFLVPFYNLALSAVYCVAFRAYCIMRHWRESVALPRTRATYFELHKDDCCLRFFCSSLPRRSRCLSSEYEVGPTASNLLFLVYVYWKVTAAGWLLRKTLCFDRAAAPLLSLLCPSKWKALRLTKDNSPEAASTTSEAGNMSRKKKR